MHHAYPYALMLDRQAEREVGILRSARVPQCLFSFQLCGHMRSGVFSGLACN